MAVQTTEEFKNGGATSYAITIEYLQASDIKVRIGGVLQTYVASSPSSGEYTVSGTTVTLGAQAAAGSGNVHIYRETDVNTAAAVFAAGSSIRAADLNAIHDMARLGLSEARSITIESDIKDGAVTSSKIKDLTIVDADIAATAEIEVYKLKDGAANQVLVTQSDGTTTNWSSNLDLPGTLDVTGNVDLDANLNVDGTTTLDGTTVDGGLTVTGGGVFNNIALAGNEIDTNSGGLTIDSAGGTTTVDDNLAVTGTLNVTQGITLQNATASLNGSQIVTETASQTLTNKTLTTPVINDMSGTAVVTTGTSTSDNKVYSAKRAGEIFYGKDTVEEIQSGETWSAADDKVATTAAIDARIIDLVDDVGGFVPIANETSFPTTNPDINTSGSAKGGTIVSVKTASTNLVPSGTTVTIANGRGSGLAVIITGVSATIPSGFGFLVETTTTDHTYAFHRLSPNATEVTTVAGKATEVTTVHTNISNINAVASDIANVNAVAADATDIGVVAGKATEIGRLGTADAVADMAILGTADVVADLNTLGTADVVADLNTLGTADVVADMNMLATSDVISDMNDLATSGNITAMSTCSTNIASINNCSTNISSANNYGDQYQVAANNPSTDGGGNALAAGDLYFNTSANELKVYNGSSWQGGVTASGSFASTTGNTFTGDNRYNDNVKALFGTGSDLEIYHDGSHSYVKDNGTGDLRLQTQGGHVSIMYGSHNMALFQPSGFAKLYYDNNPKFETTSSGATVTGTISAGGAILSGNQSIASDSAKLFFGASNDLEIFHNGSHSYIKDTGTGRLILQSSQLCLQSTTGENFLVGNPDAGTELYHDGTKKFETTSAGATVTGSVVVSGDSNVPVTVTTSNDYVGKFESTDAHARLIIEDNTSTANANGVQVVGNTLMLKTNNEDAVKCVGDGAVELYYDNSRKLRTYASGAIADDNLWVGTDNKKLLVGGHADLEIYHSGTQSYVTDQGTGNLNLQGSSKVVIGNAAHDENMAQFFADGAVELYYDNAKKFETTSAGATVTGTLTATSFSGDGSNLTGISTDLVGDTSPQLGGDLASNGNDILMGDNDEIKLGAGGDLKLEHQSSSGHSYITEVGTGNLYIQASNLILRDAGTLEHYLDGTQNGAVNLYYNGGKKFETYSGGITVSGHAVINGNTAQRDNDKLQLGNSSDFTIYHNGSDSYVKNTTGDLYIRDTNGNIFIQPKTDENAIKCVADGAVEIYHDNSKKFETTSTGVNIPVGANTHGIKSIAAGDHYTTLQFDSNRSSAGEILSIIDFKWDGDKVADILALTGSDTTNKDDGQLSFRTSPSQGSITERMRITQAGNVGIGTTSPSQSLHVHDTTAYQGIIVGGNGAPRIAFANASVGTSGANGGAWSCGIDGTNGDQFVINNSNNNSNRKIIISSTQNTMAQTTQVNGNLKFGTSGNGIDFSVTSDQGGMSSEVLDDYEEGSWTPSIQDATSGGNTVSGGYIQGKYTKIGNVVTVMLNCRSLNNSGMTGGNQMFVTNLPFRMSGLEQIGVWTQLRYFNNVSNTQFGTHWEIQNNQTIMRLSKLADNTGGAQPIQFNHWMNSNGTFAFACSFSYITDQ